MEQLDIGNLKQLESFGAFLRKLESRGQSKLIFQLVKFVIRGCPKKKFPSPKLRY